MYQYPPQMYGTQWESHTEICASATKSQQQDQHQIGTPAWSFEFAETTTADSPPILFCHASEDNFTNTTKQDQPTSQLTSSLRSVAESFLCRSEDSFSSSEKYSKFPSCSEKYSNFPSENIPFSEHFPQEHNKLLGNHAATDERPLEIPFQRKNQLALCTKPEKQSSQPCGAACVTSSNSVSRRAPTGKRRIRWNKDLHELFIMIVNRLGGPEKAKPKAILEMMDSDVLTISHIKSHLQKYRSTLYMHKALQERSEELDGQRTDGVTELQDKIHMQIEESRQLQLEVRRSIHQQLEMQQNLQLLIEEQREQLKLMLDHQKQRTKLERIPDS